MDAQGAQCLKPAIIAPARPIPPQGRHPSGRAGALCLDNGGRQ
ncbi:hypothetical protein HMPREF0004_3521 [Achromobacter piechaudii ATCC 43553]|uniref:Uncharacterized protein n=1 Tax=Achromobacter piechaudii ATCC 43553 TaxID=742159 RepID=D4XDH4_9BURK|nr:hypothetical protein HMPREF0004_3521 [Achromobacter piechaudii ATCC 43553]